MFESQEEKYAYGIGAIEKLAEYDVSPSEFIKAASHTDSYSMRKVASVIAEVKDDYLREKQARSGAEKLKALLSKFPGVQDIQGGMRMRQSASTLESQNEKMDDVSGLVNSLASKYDEDSFGGPDSAEDLVGTLRQRGTKDIGVGGAKALGTGAGVVGTGALGKYLYDEASAQPRLDPQEEEQLNQLIMKLEGNG